MKYTITVEVEMDAPLTEDEMAELDALVGQERGDRGRILSARIQESAPVSRKGTP